jgi:hypothetical protein
LSRLERLTLSTDEQREVWLNTRTLIKVNWPAWWSKTGRYAPKPVIRGAVTLSTAGIADASV